MRKENLELTWYNNFDEIPFILKDYESVIVLLKDDDYIDAQVMVNTKLFIENVRHYACPGTKEFYIEGKKGGFNIDLLSENVGNGPVIYSVEAIEEYGDFYGNEYTIIPWNQIQEILFTERLDMPFNLSFI